MHFHLTQNKRVELSLLLRLGHSQRYIAKVLGVSPSTICRELKRNKQTNGIYSPITATYAKRKRKTKANGLRIKLLNLLGLAETVEEKLILNWSPEQIAGWLKASQRTLRVCAQTIYDWLYNFRKDLLEHLHCKKGKYRRTRANTLRKQYRDKLKEPRRITSRPGHILKRLRYGHWEGDTIVGGGRKGYIATFVERKSGYLLAYRLPDKQASGFANATASCFKQVPNNYRKTLTLDNGTEMANFEEIERRTNLEVFFANPYHSWERGTNENTNGLLRFYFPKKMSFAHLNQKTIDQSIKELNTRPRKRLGYKTPEQVFKARW